MRIYYFITHSASKRKQRSVDRRDIKDEDISDTLILT